MIKKSLVRSQNIIRILSKKGICSRTQAVDLVKQGRIRINGSIVADPGKQVTYKDSILLDNKPLSKKEKRYIFFNKPPGYVTTRQDELGRKTVYDFLKEIEDWVFPVGRLDKDSEGLLIFTNDTAFGDRLTDPRYNIPRTYEVLVKGVISQDELESICRGTEIGRGEKTRPAKIKILKQDNISTYIRITLIEGKNREIRRLFESFGKKVLRLNRVQFGPFNLGDIPQGKWREESGTIVEGLMRNLKNNFD